MSLKYFYVAGCVFVATALASACTRPHSGPDSLAADIVLYGGKVITVDEEASIAEAVAIKGQRILAVGSSEEIRAMAGKGTRQIDLRGFTATPGLIDVHAHFAIGGYYQQSSLDLSYPHVTNVDGAVTRVAQAAARLAPGEWIEGRDWDEGKLDERRYLLAADLDPVTLRNPVYLRHTMGHYGVANRVALELAGITRDTPDPPGGTIDRYPNGEPTGVLKEAAQALVRRLIPAPDQRGIERAVRRMVEEFNREGMTGVKDPGIDQSTWDAYQEVLRSDALTVRVFALWRPGSTIESAEQLLARIQPLTRPYVSVGDARLVSGGVKLAVDGSGGARTAWLYGDWNKRYVESDDGNKGYPAIDVNVLRRQIQLFHDAGIHIGAHAIGDRAIDWLVDTYADVLQQKPTKGLRHSIVHANIPTDHALDLMASLQQKYDAGYPEASAGFMWWIGDTYAGNFGVERSRRLNPFRAYLDRGIRWAGGSDFGVTPFPARYGIWASIKREPLLGTYGPDPFGRAQAVDVRSALRSYTIWAARQMFLERETGSIEPGKFADIAIWDRDPYGAATDDIKSMRCLTTLFAGRIVHQAADAPWNSAR